MKLPVVPGRYEPRIEQQRNNLIEQANRQNIKKYGDNYVEGGLTIDGTLNVAGTFQISGGDFDRAAAQADSTAATVGDLVTDFNALLAKLRAAGQMDT